MVVRGIRSSLRRNKYVKKLLDSGDQKNLTNQRGPPMSVSEAKNMITNDLLTQSGKKRRFRGLGRSLFGGRRRRRRTNKLNKKKRTKRRTKRRTKKARRTRRTRRR